MMVGRIWKATATADGADAYRDHFESSVLPSLGAVDGYRGAYLLRREDDESTELQVMTMWASLNSIAAFAGSDINNAVVEPEAQAALTTYESTVMHYEVIVDTISR